MSTAAVRRRHSPEEYLALERRADFKSEFLDGEIYAMAGASRQHGRAALNLAAALLSRLAGGPCEPFGPEMRVHIPSTGLYTYPDVSVVCGEQRFLDGEFDTILNPTVLVEVLSPSTESYDRGEKFTHYRSIESLRQYVLVAQDRASVEVYTKGVDGDWSARMSGSLDESLRLDSIGCEVPLNEIYARVEFPPEVDDEHRPVG